MRRLSSYEIVIVGEINMLQSIEKEIMLKIPIQTDKETEIDTIAIEARRLNIYYGNFLAVKDVDLQIAKNKVTAIIGPSGCGKSTMIRAFNRMNELVPGSRMEGEILFDGQNIYEPGVDPVKVRRHIGMVFQKPGSIMGGGERQARPERVFPVRWSTTALMYCPHDCPETGYHLDG
jgi:ABC-type methionine transport system ATPase subunit